MEDYDEYFAELNPLAGILGRVSAEARRSALPIGLDTLAFMASGVGLPAALRGAVQMQYGPRLVQNLLTRPRGPRLEYLPGASPVTGIGQLIDPADLISITDEKGADTGFSEYSSPGVAASYEGSS